MLTVTSSSDLVDYLQVLAELTKNFNRMLSSPTQDDDDDDSDTEDNLGSASERSEIKV